MLDRLVSDDGFNRGVSLLRWCTERRAQNHKMLRHVIGGMDWLGFHLFAYTSAHCMMLDGDAGETLRASGGRWCLFCNIYTGKRR